MVTLGFSSRFNTHVLPDKTWFRRLRWIGIVAALTMPLFGLGGLILLAVFVAYARLAPDGTSSSAPPSGIDALPGLMRRDISSAGPAPSPDTTGERVEAKRDNDSRTIVGFQHAG